MLSTEFWNHNCRHQTFHIEEVVHTHERFITNLQTSENPTYWYEYSGKPQREVPSLDN